MEKINIAELLKDCPDSMELDCTMFEKPVKYIGQTMSGTYVITIKTSLGNVFYLTKDGRLHDMDDAKCIIYPKGKTTWEGFIPPCKYKDGDILTNKRGSICIYKGPMYYSQNLADFYCGYRISDNAFILKKFKHNHFGDVNELRLASEIEKQHFFQILLDNDYKWNPETKTLEKFIKPKFKVGDKVRYKNNHNVVFTITSIDIEEDSYGCGIAKAFWFDNQDDYELVPDKFDITTLKPLESKVLMRSSNAREWVGTIYSHYNNNKFYGCGMYCDQCIPYEGNEHLLGTTNDCDEYYKNW